MTLKPIDLELDDYQLQAIGLFCTQWAYFETEMMFMISGLAEHIDGNAYVEQRFSDKIKQWKRLVKAMYGKDLPDIAKKYQRIIEEGEKGHKINGILTHGRIVGDKRTRKVHVTHHRFHRKGDSYEWRVQPYTLHARGIKSWGIAVGRITNELIKLNEKYLPVRPRSLPRKS